MSTFPLGLGYIDLQVFETHLQCGSPLKNSHDYHSFFLTLLEFPMQFCWESTAHIKVACEFRQWKVVLKEKCLSKAQVEQKKIHAWLQENYAVCHGWWRKERGAMTLALLLVLFNWFDSFSPSFNSREAASGWWLWFSDSSYGRWISKLLIIWIWRETLNSVNWITKRKNYSLKKKKKTDRLCPLKERNKKRKRKKSRKKGCMPFLPYLTQMQRDMYVWQCWNPVSH